VSLLEEMAAQGHEQVLAFQDPASGLRGFLAIHDTALGPAHGGTRLWRYTREQDALADALRLSRAMTYKAALAEVAGGGGKAVILKHPGLKRQEAFKAYGAIVESLRGRFFTGPDAGVTPDDLVAIRSATRFVACGSSPELGDLNHYTASGVWHGMRACLEFTGLGKARVAIQGVGNVGMALARILKRQGMELLVADSDPARAEQAQQELGAQVLPTEKILFADCDVFAPCALGGVLTAETADRLQARIVCGAANNVLSSIEVGDILARRGILYAPDYLVNAGALIRGSDFYLQKRQESTASVERIYERTRRILQRAQERESSPARIADELAEAHLREARAARQAAS
jgi:leucine dehydrogenase